MSETVNAVKTVNQFWPRLILVHHKRIQTFISVSSASLSSTHDSESSVSSSSLPSTSVTESSHEVEQLLTNLVNENELSQDNECHSEGLTPFQPKDLVSLEGSVTLKGEIFITL